MEKCTSEAAWPAGKWQPWNIREYLRANDSNSGLYNVLFSQILNLPIFIFIFRLFSISPSPYLRTILPWHPWVSLLDSGFIQLMKSLLLTIWIGKSLVAQLSLKSSQRLISTNVSLGIYQVILFFPFSVIGLFIGSGTNISLWKTQNKYDDDDDNL